MNANQIHFLTDLHSRFVLAHAEELCIGVNQDGVQMDFVQFWNMAGGHTLCLENRDSTAYPIEVSFTFEDVKFFALATHENLNRTGWVDLCPEHIQLECAELAISIQEDQPDPLPTDPKVKAGSVLVNALLDSTKYRSK